MAELLQVDHEMHKMTRDPLNLALRRYAGMTLTNLTFGDVANKVPGWAGRPQPARSSAELWDRRGDCGPASPSTSVLLATLPCGLGGLWAVDGRLGGGQCLHLPEPQAHLSNEVTAPLPPWW